MIAANPVNPEKLFRELSPRLPDHCILTADSGTSANWFGRDLEIRPGMMASLSGNLATMGAGVPYAIGAKFAFPERVVLSFMGDGAMQMNGNSELLTIAKYWREWADPRLLVFVLNNRDLNQVTWEERAMSGDPKFPVTQALPEFAYADYAESIGLKGIRVTSAAKQSFRQSTKRSRPRGPRSSTCGPIRRHRRCRRTSPSSRPRCSPARWRRAITRASPRRSSRWCAAFLPHSE